MFAAGEDVLFVLQPLVFMRKVERPDRRAVRIVGEFQYSHVDADTPFRLVRFRGWFVGCFDRQHRVPLPGGFALDCDRFHRRIGREIAVCDYRDRTNL